MEASFQIEDLNMADIPMDIIVVIGRYPSSIGLFTGIVAFTDAEAAIVLNLSIFSHSHQLYKHGCSLDFPAWKRLSVKAKMQIWLVSKGTEK